MLFDRQKATSNLHQKNKIKKHSNSIFLLTLHFKVLLNKYNYETQIRVFKQLY